jgi:hypothetical protein
MAGRTRPSVIKRNREQTRRDRRADKAAKRSDRAAQRRDKASSTTGEDPDLAGIVAGPQPLAVDPGESDQGGR